MPVAVAARIWTQRRQNLLILAFLRRRSIYKPTSTIPSMIIAAPFDSLVQRTPIARLSYVSRRLCRSLLAQRNLQGELEHCRPKGWHSCTDRRNFVKQMTQIEWRQARIRCLKHRLISRRTQAENEATAPDVHFHIGSSQNRHKHIPSFLHAHEGDPAIQVGALFTCAKSSQLTLA